MGRRPLPGHAARVQSGKPPAPPPGPAGVHTGRPRSQRAAPTNWLLDMIMIINGIGRGAPKRPPQSVNQVQVSGDGSVSIQSGGSITISASNGSVAAWSIDNLNALTLAPGNGPTDQPGRGQHRRPEVSWRASTRSLARRGVLPAGGPPGCRFVHAEGRMARWGPVVRDERRVLLFEDRAESVRADPVQSDRRVHKDLPAQPR